MKTKLIVLTAFLLVSCFSFSQFDKMYFHNGKTADVTVIRTEQYNIHFKYANEDALEAVSKVAVEKIVYGKSGREEPVTQK